MDESNLIYPYTFTVSITGNDPGTDQDLIQKLLTQIDALKKQIAAIQAQKQTTPIVQNNSCTQITANLSLGMSGDQVSCLQQFLKNQGTDIYPSGLVTGNFGSLTQQAVINFQQKYAPDILTPVGLSKGTGFVGDKTRSKINQIISGK